MKELLLLLFVSTVGFSQSVYKGNVSEGGLALPGASICIRNTKTCTTSDFDGNYQIEAKVGDILQISYIGMKTKSFKITHASFKKKSNSGDQILSSDYIEKVRKTTDTVKIAQSSGSHELNLSEVFEDQNILKIDRNKYGIYSVKKRNQYHKISFELNQEYISSTPIRLSKYQNTYAQGRSLNGEAVYQSPATKEIFSWGPNVNSLAYSTTPSEYYPQGDIVNKSSGNSNTLQLHNANDFFQNGVDNKFSLATQIESPKGNFLKINFFYKTGTISIPTSRNNESTTTLKYFRRVSNFSTIETLLSYNDFENNLSNSNFGVNKIIFGNAVTPIHFDNKTASTLSSGLQRSYSAFENNPYYLIQNNLDKNKSKTVSFVFNHKYSKGAYENTLNANFQSSEITNSSGQNFNFARITAPNVNKRFEKFKNFSVSDFLRRDFNSDAFVESKMEFRFLERGLERNYFSGFVTPIDAPANNLPQNKLDSRQKRVEVFYNLNGSYSFKDILGNYEELVLKASSNLNYSSTVKNRLMLNSLVSAEIKNLFNKKMAFSISYTSNETEPSLQNNNLSFNSLRYQVAQFKQLQNNLELMTPKNAIATEETTASFGLLYNINYRWSFKVNYYNKNVHNLYVPVFNSNTVNWSPEVNYKQKGIEAELDKIIYFSRQLSYGFNLNFTHFRNEVTSFNSNQTRLPFAGFADVNKNYIVGQPLGVIVGNGYLRDANHTVIVDENGFPIEDAQPKVLGNANPDFVVGLSNTIRYKDLTLNFSFDWSQGGKIWNGTQQTLNYYGKSEWTGNQRNVTNYVFDGVTQSGLKNTQPVSFYDVNLPVEQNRWSRYGVEGVAEEAIEDATYVRLSSVNLSYTKGFDYFDNKFSFSISFFMNNVFIISKSKSAFSNNAMFNSIETGGLDYFNAPMMRSFGSSLTIKF
ncbi:carboxypeptidase-like regulatory domain-containing protein [Flavobacterium sp. Fl-318]|uniref:Carboxypeptidase-like regulatory domain-containing protein n=1 Tax=Flavobacterium cupriresistens TaxID=2893885 RepID=A0ABU4R6V8_9FLAO|nr:MULTISPECIES: carboxypeptidase-like regulatory domain-containing protein [unclassified Flavobacterium]MDX6188317.1 carboxypeptidase-like regulatory domain-containing protein [Flavobacterium sp. Fl-318]UFH40642.1 carboxypeptidase-like regulatory domain-containing protein [Flavobacterium sp. F-323]